MQSLSEPRRPPAAAAGAAGGGAGNVGGAGDVGGAGGVPGAAPRRRLIVEVYSPEPVHTAAPAARGRTAVGAAAEAVLSANFVRPMAAIVVVALHALALSGIFLLTREHTSAPAPAAPLEVFGIARQPLITLAEIASDLSPLDPPAARTVAARLPSLSLPAGATEIAITLSRSTAVTIGEANAAEVSHLARSCGAARPAGLASGARVPDLTLLVRVEKDGRVTDSRVEVGSGINRVDDLARACLQQHGKLTPQQVDGVAVASWQRVRWSAS
jgi:hypothetical protein